MIRLPVHEKVAAERGVATYDDGETPGTTEEMTEKTLAVTEKMREEIPDLVLHHLKNDPKLTIQELAMNLEKSESTIERALRRLREAGEIKRIGPDKGGHWEVVKQ